jgi:hypothetical protein
VEERRGIPSSLLVGNESEPISVPAELAPEVRRMIAAHGASVPGGEGRLEYQTPQSPRRRAVADWSMVLALAFFCGMVHVVSVGVVPVYERHYRDLGTKLPTITVCIVRLSRFIAYDNGWMFLWPFALVIPVVVAALRPAPPRGKRGFGLASVLILVATALLLLLSQIGLASPFVTILQVLTVAR